MTINSSAWLAVIIGAIYDHEARKKSYSLLADAFGAKKAAA